MKATYLMPVTEVMKVETYSLLQGVSAPGFNDGGQAPDTIDPQ